MTIIRPEGYKCNYCMRTIQEVAWTLLGSRKSYCEACKSNCDIREDIEYDHMNNRTWVILP